ncbi:MAG TPA: hypothetical protein VMJ65_04555 [Solirubrobacteraceae bacterium]|nr:hypothetical protein [Solirubrobacteraceae bacterium]
MRSTKSRLAAAVVVAAASIGAYAAIAAATATAGPGHTAKAAPSIKRFNLSGYVLDTAYSLGRNTGNTFQQTYKNGTVHGVPIKGPFVGTKFPVEDYVAMPIGNHELYVTWLDPKTHAIVDVFVMNFKTGIVYDYAPAGKPESSGTVTVVRKGKHPLP